MNHVLLLLFAVLFNGKVQSFVLSPIRFSKSFHPQSTQYRALRFLALHVIDTAQQRAILAGKEYQLEEREDRDSELTNLWLNDDATVTLGETDGPIPIQYDGRWYMLETAVEADKPFRLRLERTYESDGSNQDVGSIQYTVKREFWGNIGIVGDRVEVEGVMHGLDERDQVECELGYFALIDSRGEEPRSRSQRQSI